ncbi:major facilitator superfamily transporter [Daldinia vernicosa]|uniref:major facilitator superfamily transporter n=1 Tax=Daldinia vernicosa TaxID=114800 RepID=UPI00200838DC|nr:major facilitator superfamily transporter [Daldinia vernicosa]KAI0849398.1 major facilitator superfamily transporter [Daldinia vernicosa]
MNSSENASTSDREVVAKDNSTTDWPSDKATGEAQELVVEEWQPSKHEKAIIYTIAFLNLIVSLDATIIVTALAAIIDDIGGTTTQAFWIATSYLLVNAVTMPMICSISDVIGRPVCLTFSIAAFTVGTIVCCTAQSIGVLLVGRCIQGIGGGGIHSLGLVIHTDFVPLRWRPKWYSITLAAWAIGLSVGPVTGGAIAQRTTWRWIFYLMFPICGFGLVAVPYLLTLRPKKATFKEKMERIDWLGGFIFTCSATAFLIAISWGGTQFAWSSAATLVPLILGVLGLIGTAFYVGYIAKYPFIPNALFGDVSSITAYIGACLQGILLYGTLYYCPFYFMSVKEYSPIDAGVATLPNLLLFAVSGIITGRLVTRFNNFRWAIWFGWFFSCVATAMYTAWRVNDSKPVWVISYMIGGMSHGAILNAQNFASQALCKPGDEGAAAAMYIFARQFGMALGVGIGATTFQNVMKLKLRWEGLPTSIADYAEAYIPTLHSLPPGPVRDATYDAYKFGFQIVVATWLGISVLVLFLTLVFIKHADMNRKLDTDHHIDSTRMFRHWEKKQSSPNSNEE